MNKKGEFVRLAKQLSISEESLTSWHERIDLEAFVVALNEHPDIGKAFREAVAEANEKSPEDQAAVGLSQLFGNM